MESLFESLCNEYSLEYERGATPISLQAGLNELQNETSESSSNDELREYIKTEYQALPSHIREVTEKIEAGGGIPDYIVWGEENKIDAFLSDLSDGVERKRSEIFVEVKYRNPDWNDRVNYTQNQRERIPELQELGAEVYVFQGTSEDYWIERPSLR